MIPGERADQSARQLAAECRLEPVARMRLSLREAGDMSAVVEKTVDGLAVVGRQRQDDHGTLSIVVPVQRADPWREGAPRRTNPPKPGRP